VREHADASEKQRYLAAPVAQAFAAEGLYRIAATEDCHGSADDPMTQVQTIEAIAYADGSAAWNLMIGIESFSLITPGFKDCMDLVADPQVVMCSSTAAVGRADKVAGGYRISGQWQFVSGCHNSQLFGATVRVWEDGEMVDDLPNFYAIIDKPDFQIVDTWHTSGLCGSGSHDVRFDDVEIPESRLVLPLGAASHDSPLLNFPLGSRLSYNKIGVAWGMTRAAIDAFIELAEGKMPRFSRRGLKDRPRAQRAVAEAEVRLRAGRAHVMEEVRKMWGQVQAREHISTHDRAVFQLACSDSVRACIEAVGLLCDAAGTSANQKGFPLERIMRDIRVVGQHTTVAPHNIEDAGRVFLGLPAQEMMLAGNVSR
jgi:alkylation response protein AidB-like acyl-CoA dehydrogenase